MYSLISFTIIVYCYLTRLDCNTILFDEDETKNKEIENKSELIKDVEQALKRALSFGKYEDFEVREEFKRATINSLKEALREFSSNGMRKIDLNIAKKKVAAKRIRNRKRVEKLIAAEQKKKKEEAEEFSISLRDFENSLLEEEGEEEVGSSSKT